MHTISLALKDANLFVGISVTHIDTEARGVQAQHGPNVAPPVLVHIVGRAIMDGSSRAEGLDDGEPVPGE